MPIKVENTTECVTIPPPVDLISASPESTDQNSLLFSDSFLSSPVVIVMRQDTNYVENINQIRKKRIALAKNLGYASEIIEAYPTIDFLATENVQDGLTGVSTGKYDAMLINLAQATYLIANMGINNIRIVGRTEFTTNLAFGINKDKSELVGILNKIINAIPISEKQRIMSVWGSEQFVPKTDYRFAINIILIALSLILAMLLWNRKLTKAIRLRKEAQDQLQSARWEQGYRAHSYRRSIDLQSRNIRHR